MSDIKELVKEKYGAIAKQSFTLAPTSCCGTSGCCGELEFSMIGDEYQNIEGHNPDADLGLGCGIPTQFASLKSGESVLDLGSGAGNDCFVARSIVGENGRVTGIDFTEAMIEKARINNQKMGYSNVEFVQGDIENMPLPASNFDVVLSNCVLNLVPNKQKAFSEMFRVLKSGGRFCISDVVLKGQLPAPLLRDAELYVGCVAGAIAMDDYLNIISDEGFEQIVVHKEKRIDIPTEILNRLLSTDEIEEFKANGAGIYSITLSALKK